MVKYEIIDLPIIAIIGKEGVGTKEKNYSFLKDNICAQDVADQVYLSPFFLQRGFSLVTGYVIVEYGVCVDDIGEGKFRYLVAGKYAGGEVPEGMVVYEFPGGELSKRQMRIVNNT